jgi:hypothetical protein
MANDLEPCRHVFEFFGYINAHGLKLTTTLRAGAGRRMNLGFSGQVPRQCLPNGLGAVVLFEDYYLFCFCGLPSFKLLQLELQLGDLVVELF